MENAVRRGYCTRLAEAAATWRMGLRLAQLSYYTPAISTPVRRIDAHSS